LSRFKWYEGGRWHKKVQVLLLSYYSCTRLTKRTWPIVHFCVRGRVTCLYCEPASGDVDIGGISAGFILGREGRNVVLWETWHGRKAAFYFLFLQWRGCRRYHGFFSTFFHWLIDCMLADWQFFHYNLINVMTFRFLLLLFSPLVFFLKNPWASFSLSLCSFPHPPQFFFTFTSCIFIYIFLLFFLLTISIRVFFYFLPLLPSLYLPLFSLEHIHSGPFFLVSIVISRIHIHIHPSIYPYIYLSIRQCVKIILCFLLLLRMPKRKNS